MAGPALWRADSADRKEMSFRADTGVFPALSSHGWSGAAHTVQKRSRPQSVEKMIRDSDVVRVQGL